MAHDNPAGEGAVARDQSPADAAARGAARSQAPGRRGGLRTFSSLQNNRDYRFLWTGNLFANCAQWLQFVSIGWLTLDVSGSALHSIMAVGVRTLPTLLLGPWGGVLADRWDRRKLAMAIQVAMASSALVFAVLVARGQMDTVWYIYAYMIVSGILMAFHQPLRQALIANTVPRSDMANALALNAMTVTSMRLLGAATAGVLIETVGFQWNFFFESGLYLGMLALLVPMRTPYREASTARRASPLANLVEGLRYILQNRVMFRLMLINFIRTGVFMPLVLLLPAYTEQALGRGAGVGTAMMVTMGLGGLAATIMISSWGFFTRKGLVCLLTLLSGSAVVLTLGLSHWVWYAIPVMVVMGLSQTHFIVGNQTLIQTVVPDTLRGRVSSVWHYEQGLIPFFAMLIGLTAEATSISFAMTLAGALAVGLSLFFLARFRDIRALA